MVTIQERYEQLHQGSGRLHHQADTLFSNGVTHDIRYFQPFPIYVTRGEGARKWDVDGNEYVEYVSGHGSLLLGHSRPEVVEAVREQAALVTHPGASTELEIKWAKLIQQLVPSAEKVRFHSSGTEATLMAMRIARAYTGKNKILKFEGHFHGWQDYAVMASPGGTPAGIPPATWSTMVALPPKDIAAVEKTLREDDDIAAVILEPTGGNMGFLPIPPSFLSELRDVTRKYGTILIFDEVVQGFRASPGGAQGRYGVTPDITTLAKIVAGGLPGGAVVGRADIIDMLTFRNENQWNTERRVAHQGTFNANPLSASAGVAALGLIATQPINAKADAAAKKLRTGLNDLLTRMEIPGCAAGVASCVQLHLGFNHDCDREICTLPYEKIKEPMSTAVPNTLRRALLNAGVDSIRGVNLLVSAAHTDADVEKTIGAYEEAFTALRQENVLP